ncbi:hypothetical protein [Kribbella sp. NPDC023855]|uniref:hypothetical protein n=1 Tax=Kribbella sp. NPDC023855 TaxID=3154698 RepID=UPI0033DB4BF0
MGLFSRDPDADSGDADTGSDGSAIWQERGFVASAIVIGAVLVCLLVWIFAGGDETPAGQSSPNPTATALPTEQPTGEPTDPAATPTDEPTTEPTGTPTTRPTTRPKPGVGGCKNKNPDQRRPKTAPTAVTWEFEADMLIPLQQEGGPAVMNSAGVRSCFAHSPTGAVLAAMVTLGQIRNPDLTMAVLQERFVANQGRRVALTEGSATPPTQSPETPRMAQFTGFKVIDYLPDRAIIAIAVQLDDAKVASLPVTMAWADGDWKGVLQTDGSFNGEAEPDVLQTLDGYVRFGGA